jgi:predicted KAP-like P-loop ATPase
VAKLVSDRPIKSEEEDVLGFTSFADALAKSLAEMAPDDGLVISVQGEWGSGKTSAIELAQRRLVIRELAREEGVSVDEVEKRTWKSVEEKWQSIAKTRRTHIVRFNPWNFSGQDNLVRAFFAEVGATIGHPPNGPIGKAIRKITDHLPNTGTLVGGLIGGAASAGAAKGAGATLGRAVGEGAQRFLTSTLESAKRELADALRQAGKRIVVIVDDLDRLLPGEIRAMFSLVKSLGDLPNVLYVLSFDDQAVSQALKSNSESIDAAFLEKVVQVPLRLPPPWAPEIRRLFFNRLNAIIGEAQPNDQSRWQHAFFEAIAPYIQTPRGVARFSNTLQVVWPNVEGDVDLTDLVILITLQLFDPSVYEMVFSNIEALAGEHVSFENDKSLAARFEPKESSNMEAAKKALSYLFPKLGKAWNSFASDHTIYVKKREQRRICTREYYRNYFLFGRDPDRTSRHEIESILLDKNPEKGLRHLIARLGESSSKRGSPRVGALLDQLFEVVFSKPLLSDAVARAIVDLSDELLVRKDVVWEFFVTDNFERLDNILRLGLEPLDAKARIDRTKLLATHDSGLNICSTVIERLAGQHGLYGHKPSFPNERLIPLDDAEKAVKKIVARIRKSARAGALLSTPDPMRLIWGWKRLTSAAEVKAWLAKQLKNDKSVVRLAEVLPYTSYQSGSEGQKIVRGFKAETYKDMLDVESLKKRLKKIISQRNASEHAKRVYTDFVAAEAAGKDD